MSQNTQSIRVRKYVVAILSIAAAVLYWSWPLGYVLNPTVGRAGLASELAAVGQPYNWVFVVTDIVSGALVLVVAALIWWTMRGRRSRWLIGVVVTYAVFGVGTIIDTALPMRCVPSLRQCPGIGADPILLWHGIASIGATFSLFLSVMLVWYRHHSVGQSIFMSIIVAGWVLFGLASIVFFFIPGPGNLSQHYFITLCSLWVAILPHTVGMPTDRQPRHLLRHVQLKG